MALEVVDLEINSKLYKEKASVAPVQNLTIELADALIRIFDIAGAYNLDLGGAIAEKRDYNAIRKDHKLESRLKDDGKKF